MLKDQEMVEALEQAGIEVEQISASNEFDKNIVVALVKKVVQHPGADRLRLVEVTTGEREVKIVCGAPNVAEGQKVVLAQIGTILPSGDRIEKAKLRGEVSEGMLCSELELELGKDHNGIMVLSNDVAVGTLLCDMYPADSVIDVKTPANRSDIQGVMGMARDVAAMLDIPLPPLVLSDQAYPADANIVGTKVEALRYIVARIRVDQTAPFPAKLAARLSLAGTRSIGPAVDVTNYVMLETGQPLHAFDAGKVSLPLDVRRAKADEKLVTLDGVERILTADDLVIADQTGAIALAGVMGGSSTEVDAHTTEILLESAVFDGALVRKTAKRHGIRTEASARFERGLPVQSASYGMDRAIELLSEAGGSVVALADKLVTPPHPRSVSLVVSRLSKLLGIDISSKEIVSILHRLQINAQIEPSKTAKTPLESVKVPEIPWWRTDLSLPEDLAEEVVRVMGYERIPSTIPAWRPRRQTFDTLRARRRRVRDLLYGAGLFEVMTYSFVSSAQLSEFNLEPDEHLKLKNPLSSEQAYLRTSLLPSHMAVLGRNRTYAKEVGFYEISNVFIRRGKVLQPDEPLRLAVTLARVSDSFRYLKGLLDALGQELNVELAVTPVAGPVFAPGRLAQVELAGRVIGQIGQVHPDRIRQLKVGSEVSYMELDLTPLIEAATTRQFAGVSKYPHITRDIALLMPVSATWRDVTAVLKGQSVEYVDEYYGQELPAGQRSLTIRLTISHPDRTPTEQEAADQESKVVRLLERKLDAKKRP